MTHGTFAVVDDFEDAYLPTHGWEGILRENVLIVKVDRSFVRTGKGTLVR